MVKIKLLGCSLLLITLFGCQVKGNITIQPNIIAPTSVDTPRWKIYEKALVTATVRGSDGLCEWQILGQSDRQVYVWAKCQRTGSIKTALSVPAVIYLAENGDISKVAIPGEGEDWSKSVRDLFPPDIQNRIFGHERFDLADLDHIQTRINNDNPPLIAVLGTPMP